MSGLYDIGILVKYLCDFAFGGNYPSFFIRSPFGEAERVVFCDIECGSCVGDDEILYKSEPFRGSPSRDFLDVMVKVSPFQ